MPFSCIPKDKLLRIGCSFGLAHIISFLFLPAVRVASVINGHCIISMNKVEEVCIHHLASEDNRESSPSYKHVQISYRCDFII